jgi:hypothetical protein
MTQTWGPTPPPPNTPPPQWGQTPPAPPRKKRSAWQIILLVIVGLFVIGGISNALTGGDETSTSAATSPVATEATEATEAPDVTEPATSGPQILKVGETLSVSQSADTSGFADPAEGSADITVTKVGAATREPVDYGSKPERGWFVIVNVKATGTGGGLDVNPFDFYIKSPNGFKTEDSTYSSEWGPTLESATLNKGEHVSGTLVFDVPSRHGQIVYAPNLEGAPIGIWKF